MWLLQWGPEGEQGKKKNENAGLDGNLGSLISPSFVVRIVFGLEQVFVALYHVMQGGSKHGAKVLSGRSTGPV